MEDKFALYEKILEDELIVALGCTEPIALSLAGAKIKENLGVFPTRVEAYICPNIVKNAKSVTIPNTNGLKGIKNAIAAGMVVGLSSLDLEILSKLSPSKAPLIEQIASNIDVKVAYNCKNLYIDLKAYYGNDELEVIIEDFHNNVTYIRKNKNIILKKEDLSQTKEKEYGTLNVKDIIEFANNVNLNRLKPILKRQLEYNFNIAKEGIDGKYGASIGKIILEKATLVKDKAKAYAAAASDARMSGCEMPVVIISGSGNQGITTSVPLVIFAKEYDIEEEKLLRALIVSNLVALEEKKDIGRLSAFCGAISAAIASVGAITYMLGGSIEAVNHTIVNGLAIASGIICDGAKSSCAAKIALALEAGFLGADMYQHNKEFKAGEGIITKGVDETIKNVGRLANKGMKETDKEILDIMLDN